MSTRAAPKETFAQQTAKLSGKGKQASKGKSSVYLKIKFKLLEELHKYGDLNEVRAQPPQPGCSVCAEHILTTMTTPKTEASLGQVTYYENNR